MNSFREAPSLLGNVYLARKKALQNLSSASENPFWGAVIGNLGNIVHLGRKGFAKSSTISFVHSRLEQYWSSSNVHYLLIMRRSSISSTSFTIVINSSFLIVWLPGILIWPQSIARCLISNPSLLTITECKISDQLQLIWAPAFAKQPHNTNLKLSFCIFYVLYLYISVFVFAFLCICVSCQLHPSRWQPHNPNFQKRDDRSFSGKGNLCHFYRESPPVITTILIKKKTILVLLA